MFTVRVFVTFFFYMFVEFFEKKNGRRIMHTSCERSTTPTRKGQETKPTEKKIITIIIIEESKYNVITLYAVYAMGVVCGPVPNKNVFVFIFRVLHAVRGGFEMYT